MAELVKVDFWHKTLGLKTSTMLPTAACVEDPTTLNDLIDILPLKSMLTGMRQTDLGMGIGYMGFGGTAATPCVV